MSAVAIDLPSLDAAQQRLFEITAGRHFPVRFGNDIWRITIKAAPVAWSPEVSIPLKISGEGCELELAFSPGGTLFERNAEFQQISGLSEAFALAIRATLSRELLDAFQTALDAGVEISNEKPTGSLLTLAFGIEDSKGAREGDGLLRFGAETLQRIEGIAASWELTLNESVSEARVAAAFGVAFLEIPVAALSSLHPGDCLVIGDASAWPYHLWVSLGASPIPLGYPVTAAQPKLHTLPASTTMNDTDTQPSPLENLRLPVLLVAARREMTLKEIGALREGSAVEIGVGEEIPVDLQVNNQTIATGQLVRVGDKICASISEVRALPSA